MERNAKNLKKYKKVKVVPVRKKERFLFFGCMHDLRKKIKSELRPKPCSTDVVKSFKDEFRFFTTLCVEKKLA